MVFPAQFNLADLDGSNGFAIYGIDEFDSSGSFVSSAGDVNGDGIDDLIISAPDADPNGISRAGSSYVVFGRENGFTATLELLALDGANGFVINGIAGDSSGSFVSSAGDVNGDGIDDLIIGAPFADPNGNSFAGSSYVVFGRESGFNPTLELSALDGANGFIINGIDEYDSSGDSVSSAGDVNGDGIDDLIIGAPFADPNGYSYAGESYVVFGSSSSFTPTLELSALDGANGFIINGIDEYDSSGDSVSSAGDVNSDGIDDLIIGAPFANSDGNNREGSSYVVFGMSDNTPPDAIDDSFSNMVFPARFNLADLDGSNGFVINGIDEDDSSGSSVSSAGDVNSDGIDDLIIGAPFADPNGISRAGSSYVVFGSSSSFTPTLELSALDGANGFVIQGIGTSDYTGNSVSSAGDVNGDGIDDLIIGAYYANTTGSYSDEGKSYVVFGRESGFTPTLELSALDGANGFVINGINEYDLSGKSVSSAGDVNSDGIDDLIIGAYSASPNGNDDAGESYVVFGMRDRDNTPPNAVDDSFSTDEDTPLVAINILGNDTDADSNTLTIIAVDTTATVGLVTDNGDGTFDYDPNGKFESLNDGETAIDRFSYTIDNGNGGIDTATVDITINGITDITPLNKIQGTRQPDDLQGTSGRDFISASNGDDTLKGLAGDDTIEGNRGGDLIRGGNGNDVLAADRIDRFDDFDGTFSELRGDNGNDTIFGGRKDDLIGGGNDNDVLLGKRGDDTLKGSFGDDLLNGGIGNDTLQGQDGIDTADYSDLAFEGVFGTIAGLDFNLAQNIARHSSNNNALTWTDTISTIENAIATTRNDRFIGDERDNLFDGRGEVNRNDRQTTFTDLDGDNYQVIADVVEYSGDRGDFTLSGSSDRFTVSGSDIGTDTLNNIEFLKFDDGLVTVDDSLFA